MKTTRSAPLTRPREVPSADLRAKCLLAVAQAAAYIRGRQSPSGGFCFYRYGDVDEPNLGDTYYAVSALRLFGIEVPHALEAADFAAQARIFGLNYLYFLAFTLDRLGLGSRVGGKPLELIRGLSITVPRATRSLDSSAWLESVRKTIRLQQRFAPSGPDAPGTSETQTAGCATAERAAEGERRYVRISEFLEGLMKRGGLGVGDNLWDTCLAVGIGSMLGLRASQEIVAFVDSLQQPPFGFMMTARSTMSSLDVAYAGARCCALLELPVRREREVLELTLACQSANGGFAHAPTALPNLEHTYRALQTLALLMPELTQRRTGDGSGAS